MQRVGARLLRRSLQRQGGFPERGARVLPRQEPQVLSSGTIDADALYLLKEEKAKRSKAPIDWKDGDAVLALARAGKEKGIADALNQHFFKHPFAEVGKTLAAENPPEFNFPSFMMPAFKPDTGPGPSGLPALPDLSGMVTECSLDDELKGAK